MRCSLIPARMPERIRPSRSSRPLRRPRATAEVQPLRSAAWRKARLSSSGVVSPRSIQSSIAVGISVPEPRATTTTGSPGRWRWTVSITRCTPAGQMLSTATRAASDSRASSSAGVLATWRVRPPSATASRTTWAGSAEINRNGIVGFTGRPHATSRLHRSRGSGGSVRIRSRLFPAGANGRLCRNRV